MIKKFLSIILTLGLILSTFAVPSFAEEPSSTQIAEVSAVKMKLPVNPGASVEVQDFNALSDAYDNATDDATLLDGILSTFGWKVNSKAKIKREVGASGNEGDWGLVVLPKNTSNQNPAITLNEWTQKVTDGTIVIKYDWKLNQIGNSHTSLSMRGIPSKEDNAPMIYSGSNTFAGTNLEIQTDTWTNMKYEYNAKTNKISLWINGTQYWNEETGKTHDTRANVDKIQFYGGFESGANTNTNAGKSKFGIDNFQVYILGDVAVSEKLYTVSGVEKVYTDAVPENATEIKLSLSDTVNGLTADDITVSINGGEYSKATGFSYADNTITVSMPEGVVSGDNVTVKLNPSVFEEAIVENYAIGDELSTECEIEAPLNNETVFEADGKVNLSATATLATNVKFYIDNSLVKEFTEAADDSIYSFEADASALNYGKHEFKVVSTLGDGTTKEDISNFVLAACFTGSVNPGVPTTVQDFNTMSDGYAKQTMESHNSSLIQKFSQEYGWTLSGNNVFLNRVKGKSGADGDYAIQVKPYGGSNETARLKLDAWTNEVTSGTIVLEYDWKMNPFYVEGNESSNTKNSGVSLSMHGIPSYTNHAGIKLANQYSSTLYDTNFAPENNTWVNMRYEYDVDNETCSLWINDTQYWNNITTYKTGTNNLSQLIFAPAFGSAYSWFTNDGIAQFCLDNFRVALNSSTEVKKSTCSFGKAEAKITDAILAGSEKLNITLGGNLDNFTADKATLYVNDVETATEISGSGNLVSVELPSTLKAGDKVKVVLDDTLAMASQEIGKDLVIEYEVAANNNKLKLSVSDCKEADNVFSCNINVDNLTSGTDKMSIVIASYKDKTLVDLKVYENEDVLVGGGIISKTLNLTSSYDEIKVMVWKDMTSYTPWIGTTSFGTEN